MEPRKKEKVEREAKDRKAVKVLVTTMMAREEKDRKEVKVPVTTMMAREEKDRRVPRVMEKDRKVPRVATERVTITSQRQSQSSTSRFTILPHTPTSRLTNLRLIQLRCLLQNQRVLRATVEMMMTTTTMMAREEKDPRVAKVAATMTMEKVVKDRRVQRVTAETTTMMEKVVKDRRVQRVTAETTTMMEKEVRDLKDPRAAKVATMTMEKEVKDRRVPRAMAETTTMMVAITSQSRSTNLPLIPLRCLLQNSTVLEVLWRKRPLQQHHLHSIFRQLSGHIRIKIILFNLMASSRSFRSFMSRLSLKMVDYILIVAINF
jgi:hypothetical protein